LNIPARYVFGYISTIDIGGPDRPMDFHAWFEAYLDGTWWTFDARFNRPLRGRIPIGYGRDAVDVAMVTTYGPARFQRMTVWSDVVPHDDGTESPVTAGAPSPSDSEGLLLEPGMPHDGNAEA